jgi:hypothetical protein
MAIHVFVDNSNIYHGAQRAAATIEPSAVWPAVRIYYANLFQLMEAGREVSTRILAGSVPPGNEDLWKYARLAEYDTKLLRKIERDNGRLGEQAVDEMLHLKIANALLDYASPQVLVLATGDGREAEFGGSFPEQARRALVRGWNVEVWSWREQLSGAYRALDHANPYFKIRELDTHYLSVTFLKGGTYTIGGRTVVTQDRIVENLRSR